MNKYPLFDPVLGLFDRLGHTQSVDLLPMLGSAFRNRQDLRHNCRHKNAAIVACLLVLCVSLSGCYWLKYTKLMRTHVELLLAMTDKMGSFLEDGRAITPRMMNEFMYPLERAQDFARIVKRFYAGRTSLQRFENLLAVYADLVQETERLRVLKGALTGFRERAELLQEWARRVEAALVEEEA